MHYNYYFITSITSCYPSLSPNTPSTAQTSMFLVTFVKRRPVFVTIWRYCKCQKSTPHRPIWNICPPAKWENNAHDVTSALQRHKIVVWLKKRRWGPLPHNAVTSLFVFSDTNTTETWQSLFPEQKLVLVLRLCCIFSGEKQTFTVDQPLVKLRQV